MKRIVFAAALIGAMFTAMVTEAHPHAYNVNKRQHQQKARIHHGVRTGEVTRHEAMRLHAQQRHIQHTKRVAMADGRISPRERQLIQREQNHANRSIYRAKHNARYR
jgi:hypothetical protein